MKTDRKGLVSLLIGSNVLLFQDTELQSGKRSPYYFTLRSIQSFRKVLEALVVAMHELVGESSVDRFVAIAHGSVPYVTILSYLSDMGMLTIRNQKDYGTQTPIDGDYQPEMVVALFDDTIISGESIIRAIRILQSNGLKVIKVYVVMDREEGGIEKVKEETGCEVQALFKISEFIIIAHGLKLITDEQYLTVCRYLNL